MASLRNIMNVEDEHADTPHTMASNRESASSMSRNTPPNVSRSYQMPPELSMNPTAGAGSYRGPSGYSSHHQDPESSHQGNTMASPARSTTESVEYTYAQSPTYAQSQGYSTSGMRQLAPGHNPNDAVPFKLTPVTGRVSRAKKGVPVHICEMCRPPKTFTRAEHLRRHQLSHQPPDLPCPVPGCNKVFHRKDLLDRHQQRHEQEDGSGGASMSPMAGYKSSPLRALAPSPIRTLAPSPGNPSPSPTTAGGFASHMDSAGGQGWSSSSNASMGNSPVTPRMQDDPNRFRMNAGAAGHYMQGNASLHNSTVPRTYTQGMPYSSASNSHIDTVQELQVPNLWQTNNNRHIPSTGFPSPSLNSNQHPLTASSLMTWDGRSANAFPSAATGSDPNAGRMGFHPAGSFGGFIPPRETMSVPYGGFSQGPSRGDVTQSNDTVRSLPLPLPLGAPSETPLTPPATLPSEVMMNASSHAAQQRLSTTPSPTTLRQSVREAIPSYLEVFWAEVGPDFPIIHKATFDAECQHNTEVIDVLCCSLAAVGTQFLDLDDHRTNGSQLHVYVGHKLKQMTQADHWPLSLMHAILFWEYYSRFRGRDKDSYRGSAIFAAMYQMIANAVPQFLPENSTATTQKEWIQEESKRRLLSASFILDAHSVRYFEQEPTTIDGLDLTTPTKMPFYLISSTQPLWTATEPQWNTLIHHQPLPTTAGWVIDHGLDTSHVAASTYFDRCLFLLTQCIQLLPRASATRVNLVPSFSDIDIDRIQIPALFTNTATAHAYMALHYTPLHVVLSVSGDSWVFNKKVLRPSSFSQHQKQLAIWRDSANAVVAVAFAARALRIFLDLDQQPTCQRAASEVKNRPHKNISDFWGIYVCALICWAFGHTGRNAADLRGSTREAAVQWVKQASRMAPTQIMSLAGRSHAQGAIGLAKEFLERECLGGRSILLADAAGVLAKLDEGGSCVRF